MRPFLNNVHGQRTEGVTWALTLFRVFVHHLKDFSTTHFFDFFRILSIKCLQKYQYIELAATKEMTLVCIQ